MAPLRFSVHVRDVMSERQIEDEWVQRAVTEPEWVEADPTDPRLVRAFRAIAERDGRILRVVYRPDGESVFVITAFFDRGARRR